MLTDAWRVVENFDERWDASPGAAEQHCDGDMTVSSRGAQILTTPQLGSRWFRLAVGANGADALAMSPTGMHRCGTFATGWLSGWDPDVEVLHPHASYAEEGRLPRPEDGAKPGIVCVDAGGLPCQDPTPVSTLHCGTFLLWRLATMSDCPAAYCAAPSGLPLDWKG
jgi:hypothetical protein